MSAKQRKSTAVAGLSHLRRAGAEEEEQNQTHPEPGIPGRETQPSDPPPPAEPPPAPLAAVPPAGQAASPNAARAKPRLIGARMSDVDGKLFDSVLLQVKFHMQDNRVSAQEIVAALLDRYMLGEPDAQVPELAETIRLYRMKLLEDGR